MAISKEKLIARVDGRAIGQFLILSAFATLLPFYIHLQWFSGPIVNAILLATLFLVGIRSALVLALVPSLAALAGGLLPGVMAPMVPFIMMGNIIYVITTDWFYQNVKDNDRGYWTGVIAGSFLKFVFLFFSVSVISKLLIKKELIVKVAQILAWPQFFTAITGGMLAWIFLKWLKRI